MSKNKKNDSLSIEENEKFTTLKDEERKVFNRINWKFRQYWVCLYQLISFYFIAYLVWSLLIRQFITPGNDWKSYLSFALFQGFLFSLDGLVTSLLKSPFNQMCYAINKSKLVPDVIKDYIITKATESNEHCKETMKKFGIIAIASQLNYTFIRRGEGASRIQVNDFWEPLTYISYIIPLIFACHSILVIRKELKKIRSHILNSYKV